MSTFSRTKKEAFEVSSKTMAIISEYSPTGSVLSHVYESDKEFWIEAKPTMLIDYSSKYYGSSLKGRQEGTKEIAGFTHKAPIAIDPTGGIYMFPTVSPQKEDCSWFSHSYIKNIEDIGNDQTLVNFTNSQQLVLSISFGQIENQLLRTAHFRYLLSSRIYPPKR